MHDVQLAVEAIQKYQESIGHLAGEGGDPAEPAQGQLGRATPPWSADLSRPFTRCTSPFSRSLAYKFQTFVDDLHHPETIPEPVFRERRARVVVLESS